MKLIIVDAFVTSKSPTMRGIVSSLEVFEDLFEEIEVWATECDWTHPKVKLRRVPQLFKQWVLQSYYFSNTVTRWSKQLTEKSNNLIQTSGCMLPETDIRYIQFWNQLFIEEASKRPQLALKGIKKLPSYLAARTEEQVIKNPQATGEWWVVSRALAESIKQLAKGKGCYQILPNQYDPTRFNHRIRDEWREQMRTHYGFQPDEKILVFSAFGHFERKGLRQAVEAVELLRKQGHNIRFLILGGSQKTIQQFKKKITPSQLEGCIFAGLVDHIERHLVAADGFFFPSHFEAFSLAEIEAAALGLRLYLTPHYGSEMILRDPINGRLLPWDPQGMAAVIGEDIADGTLGQIHHEMGGALTKEQYGIRLRELYQCTIAKKQMDQH